MLVAPTSPNDGDPNPAMPALLAEVGLSAQVYALYRLFTGMSDSFLIVLVALLIFWRRGHERSALLMSYLLLLIGGSGPTGSAALAQLSSVGLWLDRLITAASANAVMLLFFLFPDGRFVPRWTKWAALAFFLFTLPNFLAPGSPLDFMTSGGMVGPDHGPAPRQLLLCSDLPLSPRLRPDRAAANALGHDRASGLAGGLGHQWPADRVCAGPLRDHRRYHPAADTVGPVHLAAPLSVVSYRHGHRHPALSTLRHRRHHPQDAGLHRADRAAGAWSISAAWCSCSGCSAR